MVLYMLVLREGRGVLEIVTYFTWNIVYIDNTNILERISEE